MGAGVLRVRLAAVGSSHKPARVPCLPSPSDFVIPPESRASASALLAIEVVGLDVCGDGGGKQAGAGIAGEQAAAEFGGGDILVDIGEQVDAGALGSGRFEP